MPDDLTGNDGDQSRKRRPTGALSPQLLLAAGVGATLVGAFSTWSQGAGVSLSGIEGSQNSWIAVIFALVALGGVRSLPRHSLVATLAVGGASVVVLLQVLGNRTVPGLSRGWGWWLVLAGGLLLLSSAVWAATLRLADLSNQPLRRPAGIPEWSGIVGLAVATVAFLAIQSILAVGERVSWPPPADAITAADAQKETERFVAIGPGPRDLGLDYAWTTVSTIEPWPDGTEFFPRIFADIEQADSSVHIIMFGWTTDDVGIELATLLKRKLAEGIEVRILVDSLGSEVFGDSKGMYRDLVREGAEIVVNDTLPIDRDGPLGDRHLDWSQDEVGRAEHRKLYVIDGTIAWTGGAGVEEHFRDGRFHDVMVRLTGDIVLQLQSVFLTSFASHGADLPESLDAFFPEQPSGGSNPAAVVQVTPNGFVSATQQVREMIDNAQERLDIMNPYLTDHDMIERIINAARRGVTVRLVLPAKLNRSQPEAALRHHYQDLDDAGVEIWEYPDGLSHAKLVIADDTVHFGTLNLDAWALYRDFEVAVVSENAEAAALFAERVFEPDIARSKPGAAPAGLDRAVNWTWAKLAWFL